VPFGTSVCPSSFPCSSYKTTRVPLVTLPTSTTDLVPDFHSKSVVMLGLAGFLMKVISCVSSARASDFSLPPSAFG